MRAAGLSLTGVLVAMGIYMLIQGLYTVPMAKTGHNAMQQAQQLSGHGANGMSHMQSITLAPTFAGGGSQLHGLVVATIVPGGPMDSYFGLIPGDEVKEIINVGRARDFNDAELFEALVMEAYSRSQTLVIERPGIGEIRLPEDRAKLPANYVPPVASTPAPAQPPQPAPQPDPAKPTEENPLRRGLDNFIRP